MLAPAAASSRLLALATTLDLSGLQSIRLPFIGLAGRPPTPFVAEGDPGSVIDLTVSATVLGPTKKLLILSALTREMAAASAENAEVIIGNALALSAEQALDGVLFSNAAATASTPAGILNGLTPIAERRNNWRRRRRRRSGVARRRDRRRRHQSRRHGVRHDARVGDKNPRPGHRRNSPTRS